MFIFLSFGFGQIIPDHLAGDLLPNNGESIHKPDVAERCAIRPDSLQPSKARHNRFLAFKRGVKSIKDLADALVSVF